MDLDNIDRKILRAVQANCLIGAEDLGAAANISPSTALRRLKRLRDTGVITAEVAIVDPRKVGRPLQMIVTLRLERDDLRIAAAFVQRMRAHPAVMQCFFVTGSTDYIVHLSVVDMDEFNAFVQSELVSDPNVAMTETHVVITPVKVGLAVPIGE